MFLFVCLNEQLGKFAKRITQATCYLGEGKCWLMKMQYAGYLLPWGRKVLAYENAVCSLPATLGKESAGL